MGQRKRSVIWVVLVGVLGALVLPAVRGPVEAADDECPALHDPSELVVGDPACIVIPSEHLGADTPVSYFIPPACAPATGHRCPVLYYLHGTGGSHPEGVGRPGEPNSWVAALTSGPPVDPRTTPDPWSYADKAGWVPKPSLDMILVSPDGRTQPGGRGPYPNLDTGWSDWNPRYARDGDTPRYGTPPPETHSWFTEEVIPFVDAHFPTIGDRQHRGVIGTSQGGFGSYINGLTRPDLFATMGMQSGGALPLVSLGDLADDRALVTGIAPPLAPGEPLPFIQLPAPAAGLTPKELLSFFLVPEVTVGFGDPVADQAWFRASNPTDLVANARAYAADGTQANYLKHWVNDAIPRRVEDIAELPEDYMQQVYETILFPTGLYLEHVFDRYGVEHTFHLGPGQHGYPYQQPYFREQLEAMYAHLLHWDGTGRAMPEPERFDYRHVATDIDIWGWHFAVTQRPATEFLNLTDVSCGGLTLRGTGKVEVLVPERCGTGLNGARAFIVDLGPSFPFDEPLGLGTTTAYGRTVTVELQAL